MMRPRKTEIEFDKAELVLIQLGLDLIVSRLAGAKAGSYTHAHPLARINPMAAAVYKGRVYSDEIASKLIALRKRILKDKKRGHFRLDAVEVAAAALALRVARRKQLWKQGSDHDNKRPRRVSPDRLEAAMLPLFDKLEVHRKRAMRKTTDYAKRSEAWRAFVKWVRYNLLYDEEQIQRSIKRGIGTPGTLRKISRLRFRALLDAIRAAIAERTTAQIPDSELLRLVKLASNELQPSRHRYSVSIVDLEKDPAKAWDFMFEFIRKRTWQSNGKKWRLEAFIKPKYRTEPQRNSTSRAASELAPGSTPQSPKRNPEASATSGSRLYTAQEQKRLIRKGRARFVDPYEVKCAVAEWLREYVRWGEWPDFIEQACRRIYRDPEIEPLKNLQPVDEFSFQDHLWSQTPQRGPETWEARKEVLSECIIGALGTVYQQRSDVRVALKDGLNFVLNQVLPGERVLAANNSQ